MSPIRFPALLTQLRKRANLTNRQLAECADVPNSLIAGLQSGKRSVGECQARKIGAALGFQGSALESFVLDAVNTCTERLLEDAVHYPSQVLNWVPRQLKSCGIQPEELTGCSLQDGGEEAGMRLFLQDGSIAHLVLKVAR
jgi:transcriptional regulator with XRE-family HTH domain